MPNAIRPDILRSLVESYIIQHIDPRSLELLQFAESEERRALEIFADQWGEELQ